MTAVPNLRERIRLYKHVSDRDPSGAVRPTAFEPWRLFYAKVEYKGGAGGVRTDANQTTSKVTAVFTVRTDGHCGCPGPQANMRIQYDGYWWSIESIVPSNANRFYSELHAVRGAYHNKPNQERPIL